MQRIGGAFGLAAGAVVVLGGASLFNVEAGSRAVLFNRITGLKRRVYGEGTHFRLPFLEAPISFSVRTKPATIPSLTGSKDLQMVDITLRILYRPVEKDLPVIYESLGLKYDEKVLPSIANEVLKSVVAQFNASQLITQRQDVSAMIRDRLTERARDFHIILDDVSITDLSFSKEYASAVEAKQVAQQEAERAKFIVERAREEKRGIVVRAEGEAEAARLITLAINQNPNFLKLRRLEAARDISEDIANGNNRVFVDTSLLLLDVDHEIKEKK